MVDKDGKATLSNVISVNFEKTKEFVSIENPALNGEINLKTNLKNPVFSLVSVTGQSVDILTSEISVNNYKIQTKVTGIYYLTSISDKKVITKKVLIR